MFELPARKRKISDKDEDNEKKEKRVLKEEWKRDTAANFIFARWWNSDDLRQLSASVPESTKDLYRRMKRYLLTDYQLIEHGFPRPSLMLGRCFLPKSDGFNSSTRKECLRCHKKFVLYKNGEFERKETCYHSQGICQSHVHKDNLDDCSGYLDGLPTEEPDKFPGIYALDCEMCFTVDGLELIRVSVVDFDGHLVYDKLVKPYAKILDYNTKWSGVDENDMKTVTTCLKDVQNDFKKRFSKDTIFVGHSLEHDLKSLRIIHSSVIDTSVVFPHWRGLPHKRALRNLVKDHLGLFIQQYVRTSGHDSTEDANACVKLMKWKLRRDTGYIAD